MFRETLHPGHEYDDELEPKRVPDDDRFRRAQARGRAQARVAWTIAILMLLIAIVIAALL